VPYKLSEEKMKKNKKLQVKLDKKEDTQELEQMITNLKVQIEEDKIIGEALQVFGSKCYIKREYGRMGKFDSHVDKGVLFGYSSTRKTYKCYNLRLNKVVESINVTIYETGRQELKEEENESMEQLYEEETKDEK
jgi:hypothetical protein